MSKTMNEIMDSITAEQFGKNIAKALLASSSSTAFFFIQQALEGMPDIPDAAYVGWGNASRLLKRLAEIEEE